MKTEIINFNPKINAKEKIYAISNKLGGICQICFEIHNYIASSELNENGMHYKALTGTFKFMQQNLNPQWGEVVENDETQDNFLTDKFSPTG